MQPNVRMRMDLKTLAFGLSCAVAGCDAQLSPDYIGESLLTVTGNVEITHLSSQGQLIPALAFLNREAGQLQIMEVTVLGEFPSDFRFDVFERPRPDAFFGAADEPEGDPRIAFGYIAAVPVQHPDTVDFSTDEASPAFPSIAGFSQRDVVVYLDAAAPSGSWTATLLRSPDGLPAGYGLYSVRTADLDLPSAKDCLDQVNARAAADYNRDHGTDYPSLEPEACVICVTCTMTPPYPQCQGFPVGEQDPFRKVYDHYHEQAKLELGCFLSDLDFSRVNDPVTELVSVHIGPDAPPGF